MRTAPPRQYRARPENVFWPAGRQRRAQPCSFSIPRPRRHAKTRRAPCAGLSGPADRLTGRSAGSVHDDEDDAGGSLRDTSPRRGEGGRAPVVSSERCTSMVQSAATSALKSSSPSPAVRTHAIGQPVGRAGAWHRWQWTTKCTRIQQRRRVSQPPMCQLLLASQNRWRRRCTHRQAPHERAPRASPASARGVRHRGGAQVSGRARAAIPVARAPVRSSRARRGVPPHRSWRRPTPRQCRARTSPGRACRPRLRRLLPAESAGSVASPQCGGAAAGRARAWEEGSEGFCTDRKRPRK